MSGRKKSNLMKIVKPNRYTGVLNTINNDRDEKEIEIESRRWT